MSNQRSVNIKAEGLKSYLERTRYLHNDKGYEDFVFYNKEEIKLGLSAISRIYKVTRKTIVKWVGILKEEQKHG